jgi:hypothetical protein
LWVKVGCGRQADGTAGLPQLRKYPCVPALTLGAMGCFPEWVGDTTGVPQIAADLLHRQISAAMGQQLPFHGLIYRFLIREAPPGRQAPAASRDKSVCSLPFLLRFNSCDLCFAELLHRRSQIPSLASRRRAGEIILASSGDIVAIRRMRGRYV